MKSLNKVRDMKGIPHGKRSAGRSNGKAPGYKQPSRDGFRDVFSACREWLRQNGNLTAYELYQQDNELR